MDSIEQVSIDHALDGGRSLDAMPDDLIERIYSFLGGPELVQSKGICRRFMGGTVRTLLDRLLVRLEFPHCPPVLYRNDPTTFLAGGWFLRVKKFSSLQRIELGPEGKGASEFQRVEGSNSCFIAFSDKNTLSIWSWKNSSVTCLLKQELPFHSQSYQSFLIEEKIHVIAQEKVGEGAFFDAKYAVWHVSIPLGDINNLTSHRWIDSALFSSLQGGEFVAASLDKAFIFGFWEMIVFSLKTEEKLFSYRPKERSIWFQGMMGIISVFSSAVVTRRGGKDIAFLQTKGGAIDRWDPVSLETKSLTTDGNYSFCWDEGFSYGVIWKSEDDKLELFDYDGEKRRISLGKEQIIKRVCIIDSSRVAACFAEKGMYGVGVGAAVLKVLTTASEVLFTTHFDEKPFNSYFSRIQFGFFSIILFYVKGPSSKEEPRNLFYFGEESSLPQFPKEASTSIALVSDSSPVDPVRACNQLFDEDGLHMFFRYSTAGGSGGRIIAWGKFGLYKSHARFTEDPSSSSDPQGSLKE